MHFDYIVFLMMAVCGVFCLIRGLKIKKLEDRPVRVLYMIMATCAFGFIVLSILAQAFTSTRLMERFVLTIQEIILGIAFGIFLAMRILGHFKPK